MSREDFNLGDLVVVDSDISKCRRAVRSNGFSWKSEMDSLCGKPARIGNSTSYISVVGASSPKHHWGVSKTILSLAYQKGREQFKVGQTLVVATNENYWRHVVPNLDYKLASRVAQKVRIRSFAESGGVIGEDGRVYPSVLLIPETVVPPAVGVARDDDLLTALWDASHGKRDDCEELLKRYRETYGKDRPGFMA